MSTMMSPFGLSEKRLISMQEPATPTRSTFDRNQLNLENLTTNVNYLNTGDDGDHYHNNNIKKECKSEIIHSGHFMVSQIDDQQDEASEDVDDESDFKELETGANVVESMQAAATPIESTLNYNQSTITLPSTSFAPRRFIDEGLSKLFECMSLAYSGSITSPKWKTFKGLPLKLKDKIRLNNIIWRAWHIQYIIGRDPHVCQFSSPTDTEAHTKAEAIVLEGKYWKRRQTTVIAEYHKWRCYHKNKIRPRPTRHSFSGYHDGRWNDFFSNQDLHNLSVDDDFAMDFSDNLLNSLVPPNVIDFPNPREIARSGMGADFIQPGLTQLQPSLDDFMEPLSDFLLSRVCIMPPLFEESMENTKETWRMNDKPSRYGGSPSVGGDFLSMYGDMLDVSSSPRLDKGFTGDQSNLNLQANTVNNSTVAQVANLAQGIAPTQAVNASIDHGNNGPSALEMNAIDRIEPSSLQVQNNAIGTQVSFSTQPSSELAAASSMKAPLQRARTYGDYECVMDMTTISNDYNTELVKQNPCLRPESEQPVRGSNVADHFAYPKMLSKPRNRSRSVSTPHMVLKQPVPPSSTAAVSLTDVSQAKSTSSAMERSISLPVYSQRRNAIGPLLNAQIMQQSQHNFTSTSNLASMRGPYPSNSFNDSNVAAASISSDMSPNISGTFNSEPQMNVNSSEYTTDSNNLIAQLLSNSSTTSSRPAMKNSGPSNNYEKSGDQQQQQQQMGQYSPSVHGSMSLMNYPSAGQASSTNLSKSRMSSNLLQEGPNRLAHRAHHHRLSDPEPPRGLHLLAGSNNKPIRKISSPAISPPPLLAYSPGPSSKADSNSSTPIASPQSSIASPSIVPSATKPTFKLKSDTEKLKYKEHRRVCHINAEQKRRCNIKNGFDTLRTLLPSINQNANTKISKAAMLQKAAEHIRTVKTERQQHQEECENLRQQIENLNQTIGVFQSQLPATGAPISCQRAGQVKERFDNYVKERTMTNWKFWIFGLIMESLLESYMTTVTTNDVDDMCRSVLRWLDQNCSLVTLRREVLNSLRHLSTSTNILTSPTTLREEILEAVSKKSKRLSN